MTIGSLVGWPGVGGIDLREVELVGLRRRIVVAGRHDLGRAGLRVPAHELREVALADVGEALHELLDRRGLAVVALEVEVHAFAEQLGAEQRVDHAHHLGALLVDGRGVEVVDLAIELRPHRMGEGAGVLDELLRAQAAHVADPRRRRASAGRR